MSGEPPIPFLPARHFRPADRKVVKWVVIHSAEIGETLDGAEALMRGFARKRLNAKGKEIVSSAHYNVDADSITQSVHEKDIAYHAPGANSLGIGIELCGRARQTAAEWDDEYSRTMLARAAALTARICERWGIPIFLVDEAGMMAGLSGITSHAIVSNAFGKSNHHDPGERFPYDRFIGLVSTYGRGVA